MIEMDKTTVTISKKALEVLTLIASIEKRNKKEVVELLILEKAREVLKK